jgi:hypothetical protein
MSDESKKRLRTIEGYVSVHTPSFEKFLQKWIDNDRLSFVLSIDASIGQTIRSIAGIATTLPPGLPHIESLASFFDENDDKLSLKQTHVLCQYTDRLLDYVIYIFKYYNYDFKTDGNRVDKTDEDNILLAKRLTKIYKIISNYIIGNPDLSIHEQRENINYKTKHRKIFKLAQDKTIVQSFRETIGLSRGDSQETDYNTTPLHPSLQSSPPSSPKGGRTLKFLKKRNHKTRRSLH